MKSEHQKHVKLEKPFKGKYHRNEWSIIGVKCDEIEKLVQNIAPLISGLKAGYLDASHDKSSQEKILHAELLQSKSGFHLRSNRSFNTYNAKGMFTDLDILFINGNHFQGNQQIVIIDETRLVKLEQRLEQLDNIKMILLNSSDTSVPDFVTNKLGENDVIIANIDDLVTISATIKQITNENRPPLYGLVLSGGRSLRMGQDKGAINYHGKAQREYEADLLNRMCAKTFISCRADQIDKIDSKYEPIVDSFLDLGPMGGILSAFRKHPDSAIFSLACDLPFIDEKDIEQLVQSRDISKVATCFLNNETQFPEPLITIWEPRAYTVLLDFLAQGYSCPRKVLINSDVHLINPISQKKIMNVNTESEGQQVKEELKNQIS